MFLMLLLVVASLLIVVAPLFFALILGVTAIAAHLQTKRLDAEDDENSAVEPKINYVKKRNYKGELRIRSR